MELEKTLLSAFPTPSKPTKQYARSMGDAALDVGGLAIDAESERGSALMSIPTLLALV